MMCLPELFAEAGLQAKEDTIDTLKTHFKQITLKEHCTVMDIGCGPGNVTHDLLYPELPKTLKTLVGIDISASMIEFARKQYASKKNLEFFELDITTDNVPERFISSFDHIVSFYCFQLIFNHRKALLNIFKMLKSRGSIYLNFMGNCVVFDIYKSLSEEPEWKSFFENENVASPTQTATDPSQQFQDLLKETGFDVHFCIPTKKVYKYSKDLFRSAMLAVNFFKFPKYLEDSFINYQMEYLKNKCLFHMDLDGNEYYHLSYTLLTVYASKPL